MDACIVTSGTGNAFPKDTGNSQVPDGARRRAYAGRGYAGMTQVLRV